MKPAPFEYLRPRSVEEAVGILAAADEAGEYVKVLAGGQSLIPLMNLRMATPTTLVDIQAIPTLRDLRRSEQVLRLGATLTQRECELNPTVKRSVPLLSMAIPHIAHPAIRERGTIGGSLAHADPAAEVPLAALLAQALVVLQGRDGVRRVPVSEFLLGGLSTDLQPDELVVASDWPESCMRRGWAFREFAQRRGDFGWALAAATICTSEVGQHGAAIALGGLCSPPIRLPIEIGVGASDPEFDEALASSVASAVRGVPLVSGQKLDDEALWSLGEYLATDAMLDAWSHAVSQKGSGTPCTCP